MGKTVANDEELRAVHRAGRGLVLNSFGGVLHCASCDHVGVMTTATRKEFYGDLAQARQDLEPRYGREGRRWHRCPECMPTVGAIGPESDALSSRAPASVQGTGSAGQYYVRGPASDFPAVEAWSDSYIPFEPRAEGPRSLREELRRRLRELKAEPDRILHAVLSGPKLSNVDVENALLYNVDDTGASFQSAAFRGLLFEHSPQVPPPPPSGEQFAYRFTYRLVKRDQVFAAWRVKRPLARWDPTDVGLLAGEKKLEAVWWALSGSGIPVPDPARDPEAPFAVRLRLHPPTGARPQTAALVKGLFDGVVCAFQAHEDVGTVPDVAARLESIVGATQSDIEARLVDAHQAVLGAVPRLLHVRAAGVQWAPADHLLVAGALLIMPPEGETWRLAGEISEVVPSGGQQRPF